MKINSKLTNKTISKGDNSLNYLTENTTIYTKDNIIKKNSQKTGLKIFLSALHHVNNARENIGDQYQNESSK